MAGRCTIQRWGDGLETGGERGRVLTGAWRGPGEDTQAHLAGCGSPRCCDLPLAPLAAI